MCLYKIVVPLQSQTPVYISTRINQALATWLRALVKSRLLESAFSTGACWKVGYALFQSAQRMSSVHNRCIMFQRRCPILFSATTVVSFAMRTLSEDAQPMNSSQIVGLRTSAHSLWAMRLKWPIFPKNMPPPSDLSNARFPEHSFGPLRLQTPPCL